MNAIPLLSFGNNEAYGDAPIGLSFWWLNYQGDAAPAPGASGGVVQNFITWNLWNTGIYGYQANDVTIDGFVSLSDPTETASGNGPEAGIQFSDYHEGNLVINHANIQNGAFGIVVPVNTTGTTTIENSYLANQVDIEVNALWTVSYRVDNLQPRKLVVSNDQFRGLSTGQPFTAINMDWPSLTQLANGGYNLMQSDQVYVYNYNGVSGDNFQVFYTQQAATFIVPQTISNSDGSPKLLGAPLAGLTNVLAYALYGVAIGGHVAPLTATTMTNIDGLVAPI
jgi:hypothetical protein